MMFLSIMPIVNDKRRHSCYANVTCTTDIPDENVGEAVGDVLRSLVEEGVDIGGSDMVTVEIKFSRDVCR